MCVEMQMGAGDPGLAAGLRRAGAKYSVMAWMQGHRLQCRWCQAATPRIASRQHLQGALVPSHRGCRKRFYGWGYKSHGLAPLLQMARCVQLRLSYVLCFVERPDAAVQRRGTRG